MHVVVTGANRGIGLGLVQHLLATGHSVTATARVPGNATRLAALDPGDGRLRIGQLDVTSPDSVCDFAAFIGDATVDALIHNAGILLTGGHLGEFDYGAFATSFEVNSVGPLRVVEALLPALRRSDDKRVMLLTSKMGSIGDCGSGRAFAYRMSKTALNMATKCLACELGDEGFTVVCAHPGWVQTDMGGPNALIDVDTSVTGLLHVLDKLTSDDNGAFVEWNNARIVW
jgi:NAD(P)-dependent dehydrogenase (short-subunit alcohol dehydrogenase family)